ncbi:MAG: peptide-methionine (S)-S-oxide reductase MsrA [Alphaproteobacteria bacterium]|nr:peptide-methionine (S)-S-oxide reductase MsrA [Alphaproteobacteria bacterium]
MSQPADLPDAKAAFAGRATPIATADTHFVNGRPLQGNRPDGVQSVLLGMGCFWGAEQLLWQLDGVWVTSVGYGGGLTPNPTYEETCTGMTGHAEVVEVVFDPAQITFEALLKVFWESHDPTQGMRQGNDRGSQYRSAIYVDEGLLAAVKTTRDTYSAALLAAGRGGVTTEIAPRGAYYMAEEYHQQYLAKNPGGYCNIGGTGITCPSGNEV